jgi:hypothetical protein
LDVYFSLFPEERVKLSISAYAERKTLRPKILFKYFQDNYFCLSSLRLGSGQARKAKKIMLIPGPDLAIEI